ncbi:MAG: hypothetical protein PHS73_02355 [Candidatus Peribacteraceae bacterium]|nr:hypothetical protein [Candidatus Peribacteraceae bacterium]
MKRSLVSIGFSILATSGLLFSLVALHIPRYDGPHFRVPRYDGPHFRVPRYDGPHFTIPRLQRPLLRWRSAENRPLCFSSSSSTGLTCVNVLWN